MDNKKTARDGAQVPVKETASDGTQTPMKDRARPTEGKWKNVCPDRQWFDCANNKEGCV